MLKTSILPKKMKIIYKMLIVLLAFVCIYNYIGSMSYAAQTTEPYSSDRISSYPGYKELIQDLQSKHPNWQFKILYTGLDWNQVIKNETTASHGRNLISKDKTGSWVCSTCGDKLYDSGEWKCASEQTVSYYMDPRNWLNENYIFQFETLSFDSKNHTVDGIKSIISKAGWMSGDKITYVKTDGSTGTINKSYAQVIYDAARDANISAYHLAARILQEQGARDEASSTGKGTIENFVGYYNICNIGAYGSGSAEVIKNGLTYAQKNQWTDPEISIKNGASFLAKSYINIGQNTLYLQKFDVDNSDGKLYSPQYMQNVTAAVSEGKSVKNSYTNMEMLNNGFTFVIPVYENMPSNACSSPENVDIVTQNVKIKGTNVQVRESASLLGVVITKVNEGDVALRIECAKSTTSGYYWDKIVLSNGVKGYIARNYIEQIADVTNCNTTAVVNTGVNLRNGPGIMGTTIVTTLVSGQAVTIIEKDAYNDLNGYNWVRVKLSNGMQGYLADKYLSQAGSTNSNVKIAKINCEDGSRVRVRAEASTSSSVVTSLEKGTTVSVTQENAANADGYVWDKIVTSDGLVGFIANKYLTKENNTSNSESNNQNTSNQGNPYDIDGNGKVNSKDLYDLILFLQEQNSSYNASYDINKDNKVNSADIYAIIIYLQNN